MKDFEQLMQVWQGQPAPTEQLSVEEALKQVKKGINGLSRKLYLGLVTMIATLVYIFVMMYFFAFKSLLTYAGILIMLVTMFIYVMMMLRDYRIINKRDFTTNPAEYLKSLKAYQKNRAKLLGNLYYIYVLLLSVGLLLYFIEVLQDVSMLSKILVYALTALWFLLCTFYLKNRIAKNEQEKINLLVDRLERLTEQFE